MMPLLLLSFLFLMLELLLKKGIVQQSARRPSLASDVPTNIVIKTKPSNEKKESNKERKVV